MNNKHKRILWLLNHTTLREFEVPLLINMGFEVFTPKVVPETILKRSTSQTFQYDACLTIPADILEILNQHDFYSENENPHIVSIINNYFHVAFTGFFPNTIETLAEGFTGKIFLRVFGLAKNHNYYLYSKEIFDNTLMENLHSISNRLWFAPSYPEISKNEVSIFRDVVLPLGLPSFFYHDQDTWTGKDKILFFVCPSIKLIPTYYGEIYTEFKKIFSGFPHIIAGDQDDSIIEDPHVKGFQPREVFNEWLKNCRVMFYHSQELRHLHYHPLEAIVVGMPLIFMGGGLLESLGGKDQPGLCRTTKEARKKIKRIFRSDRSFINEIREKQKVILEKFSEAYCRRMWEENFLPIVTQPLPPPPKIKGKRIGIIIPTGYRGGTLNGVKNIARTLAQSALRMEEEIEIIIYCIRDFYDIKKDFYELESYKIKIREFIFKEYTYEETKIMMGFSKSTEKLIYSPHYYCINDNYKNGIDCDTWLLISDRFTKPLAPLRPYTVIVYDYIQRYLPEMFGSWHEKEFIETVQGSRYVFTTTPQTALDVQNYTGISPDRITCLGMQFDPLTEKNADFPSAHIENIVKNIGEYIIWTTNLAHHKNLNAALDAIEKYYHQGGKLKFIMTGVDTEKLNIQKNYLCEQNDYIDMLRKKIKANNFLKKNLQFMGNLPVTDYVYILKYAKFLFHPAIIDNGTFSVLEAAAREVPSVSSDYPQMRYIDNEFQLNLHFFDSDQPHEITNALHFMEKNYPQQKKKLPDADFLSSKTYHSTQNQLWGKIRELLC